MNIVVLDTECTNKDETKEVIELAYGYVNFEQLKITEYNHTFYNFKGEMSYGALATHHILPETLLTCPYYHKSILPTIEYMIGHNIDFDWEALGEPACKRIDTLAIAKYLWPELDSHTQSALAYYLTDDKPYVKEQIKKAHSAIFDIELCFHILQKEIKQANSIGYTIKTIEQLYEFSENCRIHTIMPFGKHKGELLEDLPVGYKQWLLNQDIDKYLRKALIGE